MEAKRAAKKKKRPRDAAVGAEEGLSEREAKTRATESPEGEGAPRKGAPAQARPSNISLERGSAAAASSSVAKKGGESDVYKKLFHSDKEAKSSGRDLMMSTAGFRYGLA